MRKILSFLGLPVEKSNNVESWISGFHTVKLPFLFRDSIGSVLLSLQPTQEQAMPHYMISYNLRKVRNYDGLIKTLRTMKCISPLKSLWVGSLVGPASAIRQILANEMDSDDGLVIVEIKPGSDWATKAPNEHASTWFSNNITKAG